MDYFQMDVFFKKQRAGGYFKTKNLLYIVVDINCKLCKTGKHNAYHNSTQQRTHMLKKTLLSTLLTLSTIASAQVGLDLNLTISNDVTERTATGSVTLDESTVTSVVFNGLESLIIDFVAERVDEETVNIQAQFYQQIEEELIPMTEPLGVQVPFNQAGTITVNQADSTGSLVLTITPSLTK